MDPESCAAFVRVCTGDKCTSDHSRIKSIFSTYDTDKDGLLTEENFLEFYSLAVKSGKISTVWNNLRAFNIRNDLKKFDEIELE